MDPGMSSPVAQAAAAVAAAADPVAAANPVRVLDPGAAGESRTPTGLADSAVPNPEDAPGGGEGGDAPGAPVGLEGMMLQVLAARQHAATIQTLQQQLQPM